MKWCKASLSGSRSAGVREGPWRVALWLILAVTVLRVGYLVFLCPYELVGDEAYYWEQSRHLSLCYVEKGPALAWVVAAACGVCGDREWAVRLPMVLVSAVAAWGVGRLAMEVAAPGGGDGAGDAKVRGRSGRAGLAGVVLFYLIPAFQANAQICTQDGPVIAIWIGLTGIGMRLVRRWRAGANTWREWLAFWGLMGVGILFKQSVPLFLLGMCVYWAVERRRGLRLTGVLVVQQAVGLLVVLAVVSPMIVWNARHGWPTVAHTLGHLAGEGDQAGHRQRGNMLEWVGETVGGVAGAVGPGLVLMGWAVWDVRRTGDAELMRDRTWLVCASVPAVAFFVLLSFVKPVIPSWPLPSVAPLVALAGPALASGLGRYEGMVREWRRGGRAPAGGGAGAGGAGRKPDTPLHRVWWVTSAYGLVAGALIAFPTVLGDVPVVGRRIQKSTLNRLCGHRRLAGEVSGVLGEVRTADGRPPLVVARQYMRASLLSFYLPGHPTVYSAETYLGKRTTSFDYWGDTRLDDPALRGRSMLLVGKGAVPWESALAFEGLPRAVAETDCFIADGYEGPRADHPGTPGHPAPED